ncbi:helix-turn-helix domain-containing protein [Nostoc sp.]|uniref:helix-turn-helix domain-containing protein n=1 Tax=Nostoc sp. TaxID=1180 RepID=UPI002FF6EE6C
MTEEISVQTSSGNVFADLGLANPDELLVKAELARQITEIIAKQDMNQADVAELLKIEQPKIFALIRGKLSCSTNNLAYIGRARRPPHKKCTISDYVN